MTERPRPVDAEFTDRSPSLPDRPRRVTDAKFRVHRRNDRDWESMVRRWEYIVGLAASAAAAVGMIFAAPWIVHLTAKVMLALGLDPPYR